MQILIKKEISLLKKQIGQIKGDLNENELGARTFRCSGSVSFRIVTYRFTWCKPCNSNP